MPSATTSMPSARAIPSTALTIAESPRSRPRPRGAAPVSRSAAATTLYAVGFVTRGFEVFQEAALEGQRQPRGELGRREGREGNEQVRGGEQQQLSPNAPRA